MRIARISAVVLALSLVGPLRALTARPTPPHDPPSIVPGSNSPGREPTPPSSIVSNPTSALRELGNAISANDLGRFQSALIAARSLAGGMPIGAERNSLRRVLLISADLETVWKFATSDPSGSFYDDESLAGFHDHLSVDYPAYSRFIDEFRVIDSTGRTLYPTAETRSFLLHQLPALPAASKPVAHPSGSPHAPTKPLPLAKAATGLRARGNDPNRALSSAHTKKQAHTDSTRHPKGNIGKSGKAAVPPKP